jgi:DNA-binding phage protein
VLLLALRRIAEARGGMAKLAKATGLTREALYGENSRNGNLRTIASGDDRCDAAMGHQLA